MLTLFYTFTLLLAPLHPAASIVNLSIGCNETSSNRYFRVVVTLACTLSIHQLSTEKEMIGFDVELLSNVRFVEWSRLIVRTFNLKELTMCIHLNLPPYSLYLLAMFI